MSDRPLTPEELVELTGRRQPAAQARALEHAGVRYRRLPGAKVFLLLSWLEPGAVVRVRAGAKLEAVR